MTHQVSSVAVAGADGVYLSDGGRFGLPEFRQLDYWLDAMQRRGIETLWVHPSAGWYWRDADITAARWTVAGGASDTIGEPWWTATNPDVYGVRAIAQTRYEDRAPWRESPDAASLLRSLLAFRAVVGLDWERSPGAMGLRLLRSLHSGPHATRLELDGAPPPPALDGVLCGVGHLNWTRPLTASERGLYLHAYDVNGQYLAACASLPLGVGAWRHQRRFTPPEKLSQLPPGYYRVAAADVTVRGPLPSILPNRTEWITAPTVRLLSESGAEMGVLEAYTWDRSTRYLEPWYKALRDARTKLTSGPHADALALDALKGLYRHGIGWFRSTKWDRSEDRLYRPDWTDQVQALAQANVVRSVYRVAKNYSVYPVAVGSDCVYYLSESANPFAAAWISDAEGDGLRVSSQLGHYKVKRSHPLSDEGVPVEEIAHLMRGRHWSLIPLQQALNVRAGRKVAA